MTLKQLLKVQGQAHIYLCVSSAVVMAQKPAVRPSLVARWSN